MGGQPGRHRIGRAHQEDVHDRRRSKSTRIVP
jgi:hypothetical protein